MVALRNSIIGHRANPQAQDRRISNWTRSLRVAQVEWRWLTPKLSRCYHHWPRSLKLKIWRTFVDIWTTSTSLCTPFFWATCIMSKRMKSKSGGSKGRSGSREAEWEGAVWGCQTIRQLRTSPWNKLTVANNSMLRRQRIHMMRTTTKLWRKKQSERAASYWTNSSQWLRLRNEIRKCWTRTCSTCQILRRGRRGCRGCRDWITSQCFLLTSQRRNESAPLLFWRSTLIAHSKWLASLLDHVVQICHSHSAYDKLNDLTVASRRWVFANPESKCNNLWQDNLRIIEK